MESHLIYAIAYIIANLPNIRKCVYAGAIISVDFLWVNNMNMKTAIVERVLELCKAKNMRPNELAVRAGVTPSTVYSMLDPRRKDLSVTTFKKLCDGLGISLIDFFDANVFRELEQEIK